MPARADHQAGVQSTVGTSERVVRRVAVFRALYLGDLLCVTPALRALRARFPEAEITLIGLPWARDFVRRLSTVDRLLEFPGYLGISEKPYDPDCTRAFLTDARDTRYDLAIQLHGDGYISNGFVADLGAKVSLGYRRGEDQRLTSSLPWLPEEHETLRWLRLVGELGATTGDTRLEFPTTREEQSRAAGLLADVVGGPGPIVAIHPGAKDAARRWAPERFAAVANTLVEQLGARIILTGNAAERSLTAAVQAGMSTQAIDLAGQTDLGTFAALIDRLDLLVTNDTGASHLAAASGTLSVVLFGPTRPERWAPLAAERHRVVDALTLSGATSAETALQLLPVERVLAECIDVLSNRHARNLAVGS